MKKHKIKNDKSAYFFVLPGLLIITIFLIYPVIWSLIASFKDITIRDIRQLVVDGKNIAIIGKWIGIENYISVFKNELFLSSAINTLYFSAVFIPLTVFFSVLFAILLDKKIKGTNFIRTVVFMPYVVSIVSAGLIFMTLFNDSTGLINGSLNLLGISGPHWLSSTRLAMPVIAIMSSWRRIGYFMLIYLAGLQNISGDLYEAADIDGATELEKFKYITWPLLRRINVIVFILLLINSFNVFQEVYVMTGGGPGHSTITIPFLIYQEAFVNRNIGQAAAMSYVLFVIVVAITIIQNKLNKNKLDY